MEDAIDRPVEVVASQLESDSVPAVVATIDNPAVQPIETSADPGSPKKKKKKKKKKLTAKEKQLEKLEKLSEKFIEEHERYNEFVKFMAFWLKSNQATCLKLFKKQAMQTNDANKMKKVVVKKVEGGGEEENNDDDEDDDNEEEEDSDEEDDEVDIISHDDFKLVLEDLDIPCTAVELHVLCKLLDPEASGFIEYKRLTPENMKRCVNHAYADGVRFITSAKKPEKKSAGGYPIFEFKHWKPLQADIYPRYVQLDLKLATFANDKEFKGHIKDEIMYSHMTVFSLIEFIKKKADIASVHIGVFKDSSRNKTVKLDEHKTLEDCGYIGATYDEPNQYTIFYDYLTSLRDDPIMNSDFYFINTKNNNRK